MADKKPVEVIRCRCGAMPIWTKHKGLVFYSCPVCLKRGNWRKDLGQAAASWNIEVQFGGK